MLARFIQPEMLYAVRHALVQVKTKKAFLDYYANRFTSAKRFPELLGDDLRYETRDSDEQDVLRRVDKMRELYRVQMWKSIGPGVKKSGKPQICIVELGGMIVNLGRKMKPDRKFKYHTVDSERLLKFICDEIRSTNGEPPLQNVSEVEAWLTTNPISIEQVIEILISAIFGLSYRQRVQVKASQEEKRTKEAAPNEDESRRDSITGKDNNHNNHQPVNDENEEHSYNPPDLQPDDSTSKATPLVKVFVSYSHKDRKYLRSNSLMGALEGLKAEGVEFWTDQAIATGNKWDEEIKRRIAESDIALVLVSQAYLDSSYCKNTEIRSFLIEEEKRGLIIFPIMLSRCEYERHEWLKSRQFIPSDNKNIEEHYGRAERRGPLFHEIRRDLRIQIENIRQRKARSSN
jgi:hypothetical protein